MTSLGSLLPACSGSSSLSRFAAGGLQDAPGQQQQQQGDPWDGFLVSVENALAHDAALALLRGQREGLSPLVVHGPSGTGKSRLLAALARDAMRRADSAGAAVELLDAESFAAACASAGRRVDDWSSLRRRFRSAGLFVLDNLPALARSPMAVDELAFTLDDLDAAGAGIVVASTWPPGQWAAADGLTGRLASRLSGGLAVRLELPGPDLRRRFLLARAQSRGLLLGTQAVDWLINDLPAEGGFPPLEGILTRLTLEAGLRPRRAREVLDLDFVRKVLDHDLQSDPPRAVTLADTARAVAGVFRVTLRDLRSASRSSAVVEARHFAMYLARQQTDASFATIGAYYGGRDPATVRHACRAAAARLESRPDLAAALLRLQKPASA